MMKTLTSAFKSLLSLRQTKNYKSYLGSCTSLFKDVSNKGLFNEGAALHCLLLKSAILSNRFIAINLLTLYLDFRKFREASQIVKDFNGFDIVAYNCLINGHARWGYLEEAQRLFDEMPERNEVSWTCLVSGLLKHGRVDESMQYFERNPFQNVVTWTAAISGMVQNGVNFRALMLFMRMLESRVAPNEITFTSVIRACAELGDFGFGMSILGMIVKVGLENNVSVSNSLITLCLRTGELGLARRIFDTIENKDVVSWTAMLDVYFEMGDLEEARSIFDQMPERNEVTCSAIIARYSQSGYSEEALNLFSQLSRAGFKLNNRAFSSTFSALATLKALRLGRNIHAHVIKTGLEEDVFTASSVIDFYCKCGDTISARLVFDSTAERNMVSWNSMVGGYGMNGQMQEAKDLFDKMPCPNNVSWAVTIAGYVEHRQFGEAFEMFNQMLLSGEVPNNSTFSSLLCACACLASLEKGKALHGKLMKLEFQLDVFLGTALTDMYAKSGDIESSRMIFDRMAEKNEISWTAMIQGLAESGFADDSIKVFEEMEKTSFISPNEMMLSSVLFACSHSGLVDKGLHYFHAMERLYGIKPRGRHYTCVVDMLSRSGRLYEAEEFIDSMPFEPEANAWAAVLSGCKTYKNEEIAERTAKKLLKIVEDNPSDVSYVLLSNIHASAGSWIDVSNIRKLMRDKGLKKSVGCSWVELQNLVQSFYSGDFTHYRSCEISEVLELLRCEMQVHQKG